MKKYYRVATAIASLGLFIASVILLAFGVPVWGFWCLGAAIWIEAGS